MPLEILVTNQQPNNSKDVSQPLLNLFQEFTLRRHRHKFLPFEHQAQVFRLVGERDDEAFLVAGTAAGKTLAISVPLFWKLKQGLIRRVLLMYPTVALLEDQRKVMDTLAEITALEVGQLQGGMSRSQLIAALNKPVILATPDEVYWFFRKSVKYSSLLIYGLALVDEFVLDEAHLFNGLMLRNFQHLMTRIRLLARRLNPTLAHPDRNAHRGVAGLERGKAYLWPLQMRRCEGDVSRTSDKLYGAPGQTGERC